jgi:molecular chaperone GrpE
MVTLSTAKPSHITRMTSKRPSSSEAAESPDSTEANGANVDPVSHDTASAGPASDPLTDALTGAKAEAARLKEQWMRVAADFDNFRKRTRRDLEDARKAGREELLKDLLPVFDNLERAIHSSAKAQDVKALADGLSMVLKQFVDTLGRAGIAKVPTTGTAFDPGIHEAIQQIETDDHPAGTVVAEVQAGYVNGERLVRAAMVVVAKPKTAASPEKPD